MSNTAFLDTTVLVEATLKVPERQTAARAGIAKYSRSILPTYAMKEFRAGPLETYVWFHNLLRREKSLALAVERAARESAYRVNRLRTASELQAHLLQARFPAGESAASSADRMRRYLKRLIDMAWAQRLSLAHERTQTLGCFPELPPEKDSDGHLELKPVACTTGAQCGLAGELRARRGSVKALLPIVLEAPDKRENVRRAEALNALLDHETEFSHKHCRGLGDAVFALTAPPGAVVLTTNLKDHGPLAEALGKRAEGLTAG